VDRKRSAADVHSTAPNQMAKYRPLIEDFERRNRRTFSLERKFDLPEYDLGTPENRSPVDSRAVVFEVSAVGFNNDHTRALVYIAHYCGSLCGSGAYYLIMKQNGGWIVDSEFRGAPSCAWAA